MDGVQFTNFATTQLATASIGPLDTALAVTAGAGALFPQPAAGKWFYATLVDSLTAPTKREIVKVLARTVDSFDTIVRGQDGTIAQTWVVGNYVILRWNRASILDLATAILASVPASGITIGDPVISSAVNELLFVNGLGNLAQDAGLGWDGATLSVTGGLSVSGLTWDGINLSGIKDGASFKIADVTGSAPFLIPNSFALDTYGSLSHVAWDNSIDWTLACNWSSPSAYVRLVLTSEGGVGVDATIRYLSGDGVTPGVIWGWDVGVLTGSGNYRVQALGPILVGDIFSLNSSTAAATFTGPIYPGQPNVPGAGSIQNTCGIYAGTGIPSGVYGNNGDFYHRADGTVAANTVMYHKEGGVWIPFTTT
jgi:hypothetical protein